MLRVTAPLRKMGAKINATCSMRQARCEEYPPITITGGNLKAITYKMPIASAQVKSALLLAGLYCAGTTKIIEPIKTRDHTERMLKLFGAAIKKKANAVSIKGGRELTPPSLINIPGDISCASFFLVAATIIPGSHLLLKSVGLNPTRIGIIRVLKRMGADIKIQKSPAKAGSRRMREKIKNQNYEPRGDLIIKGSLLKGTTVKKGEIPSLIDELPILMVAACQAKERTVFEGIEELRLKETDRINSMMQNLRKMGAKIQLIQRDSRLVMCITGAKPLIGTKVSSFGDHRTAMSMVIAGLVASGQTRVDDVGCIKKSFPDFLKVLGSLRD
jgi:3-phosphoshikimate 1-carboxyvinyltransferase